METPKPKPLKAQKVRGQGVAVQGLDDFRREIKRIEQRGGSGGLELLKALNIKVAEHVRLRAVARAQPLGPMQRKAAGSMRVGKRVNAATINAGSDSKRGIGFFGGAEFGAESNVFRPNIGGIVKKPNTDRAGYGYNQFPEWRGNHGKVGYFLFPTLAAEGDEIRRIYWDGLQDIAKHAFPDKI
jgi:hypothetical protein